MRSIIAFASGLLPALVLGGAVKRADPTPYKVQKPPLDTDWTYKVGTDPWKEYPRPQLRRDDWQSLNGIWTWEGSGSEARRPAAGLLGREVMVPSCIESGLSGIQEMNHTTMWYSRNFKVPKNWDGKTILINFEAVDYEATVYVNGVKVGSNTGGYARFSVDATSRLKRGQDNNLQVFVYDPTDLEVIPIGKQTRNPSHIFYRPCSGIWQSVWMEAVEKNHITQLDVVADMDGQLTITAKTSNGGNSPVSMQLHSAERGSATAASASGSSNKALSLKVPGVKLWTPDSPNLYNFTVTMGKDVVHSYAGFRSITKGKVDGVERPLLNGKFTFMFSTLDQGYWPDGLYTPPSREAMIYDLKTLKKLGFNTVRKHIKVEPALFYQACDELGLMVIQDMPCLPPPSQPNDAEQAEFDRQLEVLVNQHKSYTSIVQWVIYNEGWGQRRNPPYPEEALTKTVRGLDKTRLINSVTGWNDHGFGDYSDNHHYANPQCGTPFFSTASSKYDPARIGIQGEFGGVGHVPDNKNLWQVQQAIDTINQTYEIHFDLETYNYRSGLLLEELRQQIEKFSCSGGVWTQTTDTEGEVNGLLTYDRRVLRPDEKQWKRQIKAFYSTAKKRGGA